jgi:hypothetical protein
MHGSEGGEGHTLPDPDQPLDPDKIAAALELVKAGPSPTVDPRQLGLGHSTVYREVSRAGIARQHARADPTGE